MDTYKIRTEHMTVGYRGVPLIRDIEIHVRKGEILSLIGPNGAGKSTILKSIIRQLALIGGTVYLDGRAMRSLSEQTVAQSMSVLMTERVQPELMTCGDVVSTGRYPYTGLMGVLSAADRRKVREAMALVHAEELYDRDFSQISDGQRQRVLLARAICQEPEVIVLDEPTSFLDIRYKLELLSMLKQLVREKQLAVVMSLHEIDLAQKVSDHILCVRHNAVDRYGTPEEIFSGGYIAELYGITSGSYNEAFGFPELQAARGQPQVFVIGGGGSGLPIYRRLQQHGIPFAAGILHDLAKNRAQHKRREPLLDEADHTLHVVLRIGGKHVQPAGEGHQQRADRSGQSRDFPRNAKKISSTVIMLTRMGSEKNFLRSSSALCDLATRKPPFRYITVPNCFVSSQLRYENAAQRFCDAARLRFLVTVPLSTYSVKNLLASAESVELPSASKKSSTYLTLFALASSKS